MRANFYIFLYGTFLFLWCKCGLNLRVKLMFCFVMAGYPHDVKKGYTHTHTHTFTFYSLSLCQPLFLFSYHITFLVVWLLNNLGMFDLPMEYDCNSLIF